MGPSLYPGPPGSYWPPGHRHPSGTCCERDLAGKACLGLGECTRGNRGTEQGQALSVPQDGQSIWSRYPGLTHHSSFSRVLPGVGMPLPSLPTSAVLNGQSDDGDAEQQGQGDSDGAEHQLQLAARGQAVQQRPRPLPKPHLGRSRTCHRTMGGRISLPPPSLPAAPQCLAWLHEEVGTRASLSTSPGKPVMSAGSTPQATRKDDHPGTVCAAFWLTPSTSLGTARSSLAPNPAPTAHLVAGRPRG